jgi:hypothetical protein
MDISCLAITNKPNRIPATQASLYYLITASLHHCITALLHHCITASLYHCITASQHLTQQVMKKY